MHSGLEFRFSVLSYTVELYEIDENLEVLLEEKDKLRCSPMQAALFTYSLYVGRDYNCCRLLIVFSY